MATYTFAIDETGSFTMAEKDPSFVCGVLISKDELTIKQKYQQAYKDFGLPESVPNDIKGLIGSETFHFSKLKDSKKEICKKLLLPLADKIYISKGKPALFANNQNWWLVAVTVVISEFLKTEKFKSDDNVKIQIDKRNAKTFGLINDEENNNPEKYHDNLKRQIEQNISKITQAHKINVKIKFSSDTRSFFVNLADVVCGFVREHTSIRQPIVDCHCYKYASNNDPAAFVDNSPITALSLIFQQVSNDDLSNVYLVNNLLEELRNDANSYQFAFDMFHNLLKSIIAERATNSNLVAQKPFVDVFMQEAKKQLLPSAKHLELIVLFTEYFSHIGETKMPFTKNEFLKVLEEKGQNAETRVLRKWEKYVSFSLREAQILFNGYRFSESVKNFENLWEKQEKILDPIAELILKDDERRDEPTTALIGTLAQSYAFADNLENAIEYFNMSKSYAIKTTKRTDSYLFTIYHRQGNIDEARNCFVAQTGIKPEDYAANKDFFDEWKLLSYCKLRALELYKNKSTNLPCVDLQELKNYNSEYPFPLIQKWEGIAAWFEDSQKNKQTVENYFSNAISNLLKDENGFAIKTLALPIIQCFAIVNNQNPFHAKYNNIISELKKQCPAFDVYVEKSASQFVIKNNKADIWERALLLPFIYA